MVDWLGCAAAQDVGAKAEGYTAADLRILRDRALHASLLRQLAAGRQHQTGQSVAQTNSDTVVLQGQSEKLILLEPH